jgi:hypothetical protein
MRSKLPTDGAITAYRNGRVDGKLEARRTKEASLYETVLGRCDLIARVADVCARTGGHRQRATVTQR